MTKAGITETLVRVWICVHSCGRVLFSVRMGTRTDRSGLGAHVSYISELGLRTRPRGISLFWQTPLAPVYGELFQKVCSQEVSLAVLPPSQARHLEGFLAPDQRTKACVQLQTASLRHRQWALPCRGLSYPLTPFISLVWQAVSALKGTG